MSRQGDYGTSSDGSHSQYPYYVGDAYHDPVKRPSIPPNRVAYPPARRRPDNLSSTSSTSSTHLISSPPRKAARNDTDASAVDRRRVSSSMGVHGERKAQDHAQETRRAVPVGPPVLKRVRRPDMQVLAQRLVSSLEASQDLRKQTVDAETNSAKYDRFRNRDDISKENKARADEALKEVALTKEKEQKARLSLITRLQSIFDEIFDYAGELSTAHRENLLTFIQEGGAQKSAEVLRRSDPRVVTPPRTPTQPGAPSQHTSSAFVNIPLLPKSVSNDQSSRAIVPADGGKGKAKEELLSRPKSTAMKRLEELENIIMDAKLESEERMDQFESVVREMVQEEVETQMRDAREERAKKKAMLTEKHDKAPATQGETNEVPVTNLNGQGDGKERSGNGEAVEEGEIRPPESTAAQLPSRQDRSLRTDASTTKDSLSPQLEDVDPPVSREHVNAAIQSLREEFDTKLYAQEMSHRQGLDELNRCWQSTFRTVDKDTSLVLHKHYGVLENHGEMIHRHQAYWQGTQGVLASVPKPTNSLPAFNSS
ncbi:hypothetical protein CBS101457_001482 [Exobasidium rhododendri]|nr:hypothetical protein CBS101457_001482 [Exobasidium rhododendri]